MINTVENFTFFELLLVCLDVYFVWLIIYYILKLIKSNVRAVQILKGVMLIYLIDIISQIFDLLLIGDYLLSLLFFNQKFVVV